jgi:hypothetical protein
MWTHQSAAFWRALSLALALFFIHAFQAMLAISPFNSVVVAPGGSDKGHQNLTRHRASRPPQHRNAAAPDRAWARGKALEYRQLRGPKVAPNALHPVFDSAT